jgi:transposase InsO family protein
LFEENTKPVNLNIDLGAEFKYNPFQKYIKDNNITLWVSDPQQMNKNAIIERLHRILRNLILRYETAFGKSYIKFNIKL